MFQETTPFLALSRLQNVANHLSASSVRAKTTSSLSGKFPFGEKHLKQGSKCPPLKDGVLRFYSMRFCPFAYRTRLVLEYKKIPYEIVHVNVKYKPDWFVKKNLLGLVPVLEKGDLIINESTATSEWLDDVYPEPRLQSSDPYRKALDRVLFEHFSQKLTGILYRFRDYPAQFDKTMASLRKHLKFFDKTLETRGGPFFGGSTPGMNDFYFWPHMELIKGNFDSPDFFQGIPNLEQWFKSMNDLPAVRDTQIDIRQLLHFFSTLAAGNPDYDYGIAA